MRGSTNLGSMVYFAWCLSAVLDRLKVYKVASKHGNEMRATGHDLLFKSGTERKKLILEFIYKTLVRC